MAEATVQLTCTVEDGPIFRVAASITQAVGISDALFVYQSGAVESQDLYVRIATLNDISGLGIVRAAEGDLYRKTTARVDSTSVVEANSVKLVLKNRLSQLVAQSTEAAASFVGVVSHDLPLEGE